MQARGSFRSSTKSLSRGLCRGAWVLVAVMALMFAAPALGEETAAGQGAKAREAVSQDALPQNALPMDEVVVSASRFAESAAEVPNRVVVIAPRAADEARSADLGQLLLGRSSFDVRTQGNPGTVQTISLRGASTNQVLVLVDGRPVNSVTTGGANLSEILLDQIERVEVIEGPYSHLYGSGAVGGVVNVITKRPPPQLAASAFAAYGSANTQLYRATAGDTVGRFGFVLSGERETSDGFRPNSDLTAHNASGKFTFQAGPIDLSLFSNVFSSEIGVPGSKPGPGEAVPLGNSEARNLTERMKDDLVNNTLVAETSPAPGLNLRARLYQDLRQIDDFGRDTNSPNNFITNEIDTLIFGGSLEAEVERGRHRFAAGFDWHHDAVEVEKTRTPLGGATAAQPGFEGERTSVGGFARERLQVTEPLALFVGARIDYDTTFGTQASPSAGLQLTLGDTVLRGSVSRVYRAPTFNELFWPNAGNPDLKPESGVGGEVGARREFLAGKLAADLSLFYWQINNKIDWRLDPVTFAYTPQNVDKQDTKGATLAVEARPWKGLTLAATYSLLVATQQNTEMDWMTFEEVTVRRKADLVPRHQVTAQAAWEWETGTRLWTRLLFMSERQSRYKPGEPLEPAVVLWAGASQKLGKGVELFLEAENLLDEDYSFQAGLPGDGNYPAPPLNFLGGLRLSY